MNISKQAVLALLDKYKLNTKTGPILLREDINRLPSISEDGFKRDIIFKLSLALSDYFNDDQLSLIKQCLNKLIPVPISDGWISVETLPTDEFWKRVLVDGKHHILPHTFDGENWYEYGSSCPVFNVSHYKDFEDFPPVQTK